jgi:hypothetical protein
MNIFVYIYQQYNYQNKYNSNADLEKIKDNENKFDLKIKYHHIKFILIQDI